MSPLLFVLILTLSSFSVSAEDSVLFQFVKLETSMGTIRLKLYKKEAPVLVANFVGLANGTTYFRDPKTGKTIKDTPFYKDMIFHRVHPKLGIQTGCPWGNGKGWPGFTIKQEKNDLTFDRPYLVAMSQIIGDDKSIGSQFFITTKKSDHLDGRYTVIGIVDNGTEVVDKISRAPRDATMKPLQPITLKRVVVE